MKKMVVTVAALCLFAAQGFAQTKKAIRTVYNFDKVHSLIADSVGLTAHISTNKRIGISYVKSCGDPIGGYNFEAGFLNSDLGGGKFFDVHCWDAEYRLDAKTGVIQLTGTPFKNFDTDAGIKKVERMLTLLITTHTCPS